MMALSFPRLVHVTTIPLTLEFFRGQIGFMKERGFEVCAVSSPGPELEEIGRREGIGVYGVPMERRISPLGDLKAFLDLCSLFRRLEPAIVHAHTPKGGLLGVMAARMAGVKVALYTMHGIRFSTAVGIQRSVLRWAEALTCRAADRVFSVSRSNHARAVAEGLCSQNKIHVLARGSCNGVDADGRFNPEKLPSTSRLEIRHRLGIPPHATVLGYVGRIVKDKGLVVLADAWSLLRERFRDLHLVLVGPLESQDPVPQDVLNRLRRDERVRFTDWVWDPVPYYAAMDIVVLPTFREGFPVTPLEASAMEIPVVASAVDGCVEAVVHGGTGLLVPPGDRESLVAAVHALIMDSELRRRMGRLGRQRVIRTFKPEAIWQELLDHYLEMMTSRHKVRREGGKGSYH
jgi:glycosyltransferase involved in cell wall biosynthesis